LPFSTWTLSRFRESSFRPSRAAFSEPEASAGPRQHYTAPHIAAALPAAGAEAHYATTICEYPINTLLAIERDFGEEGIVESLKVVKPNAGSHSNVKLWAIEED
jgi:hypothetical protein